MMRVWLIQEGEYVPIQNHGRAMRTGMLANVLSRRGHAVTWWHSTFSHQDKELLCDRTETISIENNFRLRLLHAGRYERNFSLARFRHHRRLARAFIKAASHAERPDVIVCSYPPIELTHKTVQFGRENDIPSIVDIRDYWPDTYLDRAPRPLRFLFRFALSNVFAQARRSFAAASYLVSMGQGPLNWAMQRSGRDDHERSRVFHIGADDVLISEVLPNEIVYLKDQLQGKVVVFFVGAMGQFYDIVSVAKAAVRLYREGHHHIHFILAGGGDRFEEVEEIAMAASNVTLPGWIPAAQIPAYMAISDIALLPHGAHGYESFPNKVFEYMSAGLPILSSAEGEVQEVLTKNDAGFSYAHDDYDTFYDLVLRLAADAGLRARMGANARALFEREFRAEVIYERFADFVEEVAAEHAMPVGHDVIEAPAAAAAMS